MRVPSLLLALGAIAAFADPGNPPPPHANTAAMVQKMHIFLLPKTSNLIDDKNKVLGT
jgi:hypothetical protein